MFKSSERIFGLDIMRALAILLVVFSHTAWIAPDALKPISTILGFSGVMGVELFFVLSGFLIGKIIYKIFVIQEFSFKRLKYFWVRRWLRTLPNYYLVLVINMLLALYLGYNVPNDLWKYFVFLQNFSSEMPRFFNESWSLSVEEFAYVLGPLLLLLVLLVKSPKDKSKLFLKVTLFVIGVFVLTKIAYNQVLVKEGMSWDINLRRITVYRIDAIYYGILAAYFYMLKPKQWNDYQWHCFVLGFVLFLGANIIGFLVKTNHEEVYALFWNVLYLPINSIAIALCLPVLTNVKSAPKFFLLPITFISLISYSMYLLNYSFVIQLLKHFIPSNDLSRASLGVYVFGYFILVILFSFLLYRFFEKPIMDLRDKPFITKKFKD